MRALYLCRWVLPSILFVKKERLVHVLGTREIQLTVLRLYFKFDCGAKSGVRLKRHLNLLDSPLHARNPEVPSIDGFFF